MSIYLYSSARFLMYKIIIFIYVFYFSTYNLFSQEKKQYNEAELQPSTAIEENYSTTEKSNLEVIEEKNGEIKVKGDDESFYLPPKKETDIILPNSTIFLDKENYEISSDFKKKINKKINTNSYILQAHYGAFNLINLYTLASVHTSISTHTISYTRNQKDSEGRSFTSIPKSSFSANNLIFDTTFYANKIYSITFNIQYEDNKIELQNNPLYQFLIHRNWNNTIYQTIVTNNNIYKLAITGNYNLSQINKYDTYSSQQKYLFLSTNFLWRNIILKKYIIGLNFKGSYSHFLSTDNNHLWGILDSFFQIPLYSFNSNKKNITWDLLSKIVAGIYIDKFKTINPNLAISLISRLNFWELSFNFYKENSQPTIKDSTNYSSYFELTYFTKPLSEWKSSIDNNFYIYDNLKILTQTGWIYFDTYYTPIINANYLYQYSTLSFYTYFSSLGFEHNIKSIFTYNFKIIGELHQQTVYFRSPLSIEANIYFSWKNFGINITSRFLGNRVTQNIKLEPYILLNTKLYYNISKSLQIYVEGINLLNYKYTITPNYATSGIVIFGGLYFKI